MLPTTTLHDLIQRQAGIPQERPNATIVLEDLLVTREAHECPNCHTHFTKAHLNLSRRHRQLLDFAITGKTDKEIATELGLATLTVRTYWKPIHRAFGTHSRVELALKWQKFRLEHPEIDQLETVKIEMTAVHEMTTAHA